MDNRPIGVFDSGLGGLTVVRELSKHLPHENLIYFGDTGRVPYGSRSPEMIRRFALQDSRFLLSHDVKCIIAACGTVSSIASDLLSSLPVPAWGVVEPTADQALSATKNGKIGVLGTAVTVQSRSFELALQNRCPTVQVIAKACPVLVSLVESGWIEEDNLATEAVLRRYLQPLIDAGVDTVILGCTHFPLLSPLISRIMGEEVTLINSGAACAAHCKTVLQQNDASAAGNENGHCEFFVSDRPHNFTNVAQMFLGKAVEQDVHQIRVEDLS
ncbi:MAG: glutamate racemase [Clostridia bacterium]|nr:glutamate racemase [Clostridia bacterium]